MEQAIYDKINDFFKAYPLIRMRKNQAVTMTERDKPDILWIRQGMVRMYQIANDGSEITLHLFRAPTFFPIMLYLSHRQTEYYFQATEVVIARKAPAEDVEAFLRANPDVLFDLTRRFADAITGLLLRIEQLSSENAYQRVASYLLYMAHTFGERTDNGYYAITKKLSHEDIAKWTGMARETVSHQMEHLTKEGILKTENRKRYVLDFRDRENKEPEK